MLEKTQIFAENRIQNILLSTNPYCFRYYVTVFFLLLTVHKLLLEDWRRYIVSEFTLVGVTNAYRGIFALIRQSIKKEKTEIAIMQKNVG